MLKRQTTPQSFPHSLITKKTPYWQAVWQSWLFSALLTHAAELSKTNQPQKKKTLFYEEKNVMMSDSMDTSSYLQDSWLILCSHFAANCFCFSTLTPLYVCRSFSFYRQSTERGSFSNPVNHLPREVKKRTLHIHQNNLLSNSVDFSAWLEDFKYP